MRLIKIVIESFNNNECIPAVSSFSFSIELPLDDDNKNTMTIKLSNFLHATVPESRAGPDAGDIAEGVCFVATKGRTKKTRGCYLIKSACLANSNCQPKAYAELNTRRGKESALALMRSTLDGL
jgi:hypothetical protein